LGVAGEEPRGDRERALPEPLALPDQPRFERLLIEVEAGQQLTAIEGDRALEVGRPTIRDQTLEGDRVDLDGFRIQRDHVAVDPERFTPGAERRPQALE